MGVLSRGMADTGELSPWFGAWLPTLIMFPFGLYLNYRAIQDKGAFDLDLFVTPVKKVFSKFTKEAIKKT